MGTAIIPSGKTAAVSAEIALGVGDATTIFVQGVGSKDYQGGFVYLQYETAADMWANVEQIPVGAVRKLASPGSWRISRPAMGINVAVYRD